MVHMPSDQQPPSSAPPPQEAVVEFGTESDEPSRPPRRHWHVSGLAVSLVADRRMVPLAAVLAGVALFASLVSEWQTTSVDTTDFGGIQSGLQLVPTDLVDLGSWGAGYLAGLFVLTGATVLALFGPGPGRRYAQLVGMSTGGVLLALLAAMAPTLDDVSRTLGYLVQYTVEPGRVQQSVGRGVWCGFVGVVLAMITLYLAGRHTSSGRSEPAADGAEPAVPEPPPVWSWRRPQTVDEDPPAAEPFDLTVTSTTPFTSLNDDRDKPTDRDQDD